MRETLAWQRFEWKTGADGYVFEVQQGGLFGTLSAPANRTITLPMVAWEGLLDCVRVTRRSQSQPQSRALAAGMPARSGARWTDAETEDLIEGFHAGKRVAQLADHHGRTAYAVELQLEKLGLRPREAEEPQSAAESFPNGRFG